MLLSQVGKIAFFSEVFQSFSLALSHSNLLPLTATASFAAGRRDPPPGPVRCRPRSFPTGVHATDRQPRLSAARRRGYAPGGGARPLRGGRGSAVFGKRRKRRAASVGALAGKMAVNKNHAAGGGVIPPYGERIIIYYKDVELTFTDVTGNPDIFKGTKKGMVFLTHLRVIFVSQNKDPMMSFMMPFRLMKKCSIEQPVFSPNYIKGVIEAEPGGGWVGQASFKMSFYSGGAVEFGKLMFKFANDASRGIPPPNYGYGYPPGFASYGPSSYAAPGTYVYVPVQENQYGVAPQPGEYGYGPPPGMYPPPPGMTPMYMAPPPPYPGPSAAAGPSAPREQEPTTTRTWAEPGMPGGNKAVEATFNAYYNPANPHNVYMPLDPPPPYEPPDEKKNK